SEEPADSTICRILVRRANLFRRRSTGLQPSTAVSPKASTRGMSRRRRPCWPSCNNSLSGHSKTLCPSLCSFCLLCLALRLAPVLFLARLDQLSAYLFLQDIARPLGRNRRSFEYGITIVVPLVRIKSRPQESKILAAGIPCRFRSNETPLAC